MKGLEKQCPHLMKEVNLHGAAFLRKNTFGFWFLNNIHPFNLDFRVAEWDPCFAQVNITCVIIMGKITLANVLQA
jgi:hypothetical protein